ncbi:MAG: family 10 glycosylhydrolase [Bacteroidota bacterium]
MSVLYKLLLIFLLVGLEFVIQPVWGQVPKREFRAVWVSTVANIDWPSKAGLSSEIQQEQVIRILDHHKRNGVNAIILQVRPTADAIYPSDLEPWSKFISGVQGKAPEPFYDPLRFWVEEAHRRGMELHAWFNPYRINLKPEDSLAVSHIALQHPEWCFTYGSKSYFSPANPQVWAFVTSVVVDVVRRYDIDAVHFDDYFYPYRIAGEPLPDTLDFQQFGGGYYPDSIESWRRHNVDTIIQVLHHAIASEKPWVKFGISPFGVWRNRSEDPLGSETKAGTTNYDALYADVILWQKEGWIDYLMPQLYWRDDHPAAGFSTLAYWWNDYGYSRSVYVGIAPYRIDRKSDHQLWRKEKYLRQQIDLVRTLEGLDGFGYFSSRHFFRKDLSRLDKKIRTKCCSRPALVPTMPWIDSQAPAAPFNLRVEGNRLLWEVEETDNEMDRSRFYVLYRYDKGENSSLKAPGNMDRVTGEQSVGFESGIEPGTYRVSALDRLNNESPLSQPLEVR